MMISKIPLLILILGIASFASMACDRCKSNVNSADFKIKSAKVVHNRKSGQLEFTISVEGKAGASQPKPVGKLDGAPVFGYVFPTSLRPEDVGFNKTEGVVALALTSHPDFDDSPLWDENGDGIYDNDGLTWHPHWVVLVKDDRVEGGLSVREFEASDKTVKLPPTAPAMPMYMDSPGFQVVCDANSIRVAVPVYRVRNQTSFRFDAVTCYMEVSTSGNSHGKGAMPMLGVHKVFSVLSGNLSMPYTVE